LGTAIQESLDASATGASRLGSDLWIWGSVVSSHSPDWGIFSYIQIKSELIFGHWCCRDGQIGTNLGH